MWHSSSSSCHQTKCFHMSTHYFALSLNLMRSSKGQGCASLEHCIMHVAPGFFFFSTGAHSVSSVVLPLFRLDFTAGVASGQTIQASPCGPWAVITFSHFFMIRRFIMSMCCLLRNLFCHSLYLMTCREFRRV